MGKLLTGGGLVALAAFMLLGFFNLSQPLGMPVAVLTLLVAVGVPGVAGAALLRAHFRERARLTGHRERLRLETHQAELVRLAERRGGKLTGPDLVLNGVALGAHAAGQGLGVLADGVAGAGGLGDVAGAALEGTGQLAGSVFETIADIIGGLFG